MHLLAQQSSILTKSNERRGKREKMRKEKERKRVFPRSTCSPVLLWWNKESRYFVFLRLLQSVTLPTDANSHISSEIENL